MAHVRIEFETDAPLVCAEDYAAVVYRLERDARRVSRHRRSQGKPGTAECGIPGGIVGRVTVQD
jgi:hypothetical protein